MIIYKITNLINNKIYIGQHNGKRSTYFGGGKLLKKAINKYGLNNFEKTIIEEGSFTQELTDELEKHYIKLYDSTNKEIGYNIQKGGRGYKNNQQSDIVRELTRKRMIGNKIMLGKKRSEESINKQSETWKKILNNKSKEEKRTSALKAVETRKQRYDIGKLISESRQSNKKLNWNNKQTKPVVKLDLDNNVIEIYSSAYEVEKLGLGISSRISAVCNKIYGCKTYKGSIWRFATKDEIIKAKSTKK